MTLSEAISKEDFGAMWVVFTPNHHEATDWSGIGEAWWELNQHEEVINPNVEYRFNMYVWQHLYNLEWTLQQMSIKFGTSLENVRKIVGSNSNTGTITTNEGEGFGGYSTTNQNNQFRKNTLNSNSNDSGRVESNETTKNLTDIREWINQDLKVELSKIFDICQRELLVNIW